MISSKAEGEDFIQTRLDFTLQSRISLLLFFRICAILNLTSKFKAIKELEIVINSFLSFIEEYDNSLKQNTNRLSYNRRR